jgi:hypothetical protein
MATCADESFRSARRDQFLGVLLAFVVIRDGASGRDEVILLERGCWSRGGGFVILLLLRQWEATDLGPRQHGTSPGRCATSTCASLHAEGLFIDSQSLFGDCAFSDFALVEARYLLRCSSWRRWRWVSAARYDGCRKPSVSFCISWSHRILSANSW